MCDWCALCAWSGTHGPAHLDARIDAFLGAFAKQLGAMSEDELEGHRQALIAAKTLKDASLHDEADRNWEQIGGKTCARVSKQCHPCTRMHGFLCA